MFVKSSMDRDVKYAKSTGVVILKANTVTLVDENIVSAKELKACYGNKISIMAQDFVDEITPEEGEVTEGATFITGNEEVDAFLNGETEKLPEGTELIDEEEALKLQKEAEEKAKEEERLAAEAKAKEEERLAAEAKAKEEAEKLEALKIKEAAEKAAAEAKAKEEAEAKSTEDTPKSPRTLTRKNSTKSKGKAGSKKK